MNKTNAFPGFVKNGPSVYNDIFSESYSYMNKLMKLNSNDKSLLKQIDEFIAVAKTVPPVPYGQVFAFGLAAVDRLFDWL